MSILVVNTYCVYWPRGCLQGSAFPFSSYLTEECFLHQSWFQWTVPASDLSCLSVYLAFNRTTHWVLVSFQAARPTCPVCSFSPTSHNFRAGLLVCLLPIRKPSISPVLGHHHSCLLFPHGMQLEVFSNHLFIYSILEIQNVLGWRTRLLTFCFSKETTHWTLIILNQTTCGEELWCLPVCRPASVRAVVKEQSVILSFLILLL